MVVISDIPEHPVITHTPTIRQTISNFTAFDCAQVIAFPILAYPFGLWAGAKTNTSKICMGKPTALVATLCGLMCGVAIGIENSAGRLMGFKENQREVMIEKTRRK